MDYHVKEYYRQSADDVPRGHFHQVIPLHEERKLTWESASRLIPDLCKGWYELAHLETKDRIEFTRDFWLSKMPYHSKFPEFLSNFFEALDNIGVYAIQKKFDDPFEAHLVYCLDKDAGFFKGYSPASEEDILNLEKAFPDCILPVDYLAFLQIHNGFCKSADCTGLASSKQMKKIYQDFQNQAEQKDPIMTAGGVSINPHTLIPFYESFGMPFFQCFWAEWYPEQEMGNVYYSGIANTISDVQNRESQPDESMAFPTFTDWLMFYLEKIQ